MEPVSQGLMQCSRQPAELPWYLFGSATVPKCKAWAATDLGVPVVGFSRLSLGFDGLTPYQSAF